MTPEVLSIRKTLNKAYLKVKPSRSQIELLKSNLLDLFHQINKSESEEYHKNLIAEFLKKTYYHPTHSINTKGRADLVIHNGKDSITSVGVIIETKRPGNKAEMPTKENLNTKAVHELVLYYLRERINLKNLEVKHLIATDLYEWYIFNAQDFEKIFAKNKKLVKDFESFVEGRLSGTTTDFFYGQIAKPFIDALEVSIPVTWFDIRDFEIVVKNDSKADDNKLIGLYKILSPEHLLKLPFANDSNTLDKRFYNELLHIIGLEETKEGSKKLIGRKAEESRNNGSLIENAINILRYEDCLNQLEKPSEFGANYEDQLYNIALELTITWINRILFIKLLEGQLIKYHQGDESYKFLNSKLISNYDALNKLFFHVLAVKESERLNHVKEKYGKIPYLNSSLFEPNQLEHKTIRISNLEDDFTIPILNNTVLKDSNGKKIIGEINPLRYLIEFLDSYDFSSEGSEDISEENKPLINASVLGLIFEKINGYKDGSFFTPGFITMYMCRETIRRAVVQKFNDAKDWNCETLDELYNKIEDKKEANGIINSLKICDPAVGSGHFLVSALNEIISIKSELKILSDSDGKVLRDYHVEVINDELVITNEDGEFFEYHPKNPESQRIQETLFHEKQTIIENCLFGVDINQNSVKICRLRLWIELLKNAYYRPDSGHSELETLPNIDINIKCGNSLISRYPLDADIKSALAKSKWTIDSYRLAIMTYRNAESKEEKASMRKLIDEIKTDFESEVTRNDKRLLKSNKLKGELSVLTGQQSLFELSKKEKAEWEKKVKKIVDNLEKLESELEEIKNNKIYENAFDWRFEFPEVLNDEGDLMGFDIVIGNPPYIRQEDIKEIKPYLQNRYSTSAATADLFVYFIELGVRILKPKGKFIFIIPNKWMRARYGKALRAFLKDLAIESLIDFGDLPVFEEATTYPCILSLSNEESKETFEAANIQTLKFNINLSNHIKNNRIGVLTSELLESGWTLTDSKIQKLLSKLRGKGIPLGEYTEGKILRGITTGYNEAFIIEDSTRDTLIKQDPQSSKVIKPFLVGRNIKRFIVPMNKQWLIFIPWHFPLHDDEKIVGASDKAEKEFEKTYPAVYSHLKQYKVQLESRNKSETGIRYEWYALQRCAASYFQEFDEPKVILPDISSKCEAIYDENGEFYCLNTAYIIPRLRKSDLGILNSTLVLFFYANITQKIRGGYYRFIGQYLEQIPFVESSSLEGKVNQILDLKKENSEADISVLEREIDQLVYELYDLTAEEIKIIEESVA